MTRLLTLIGYAALMVFGWFLFELQNVWPFNEDNIPLLRFLFFVFSLASFGALLFSRARYLSSLLMMMGFMVTSTISQSDFNPYYFATAALVSALTALLTRLFGSPLSVR